MAVDEALSAYSTTASSNTPAGTDTVGPDLDNHLRDMKKNQRRIAESFKGLTDGGFDGAIRVDDSASPSWTVSIRGGGANISLFDVDVSAGTADAYIGGATVGTFSKQLAGESTSSAKTTIMGSLLASIADEATTASASHAMALAGLGPPIGSTQSTVEATAPDGWLAMAGETLGNVSASATHANSMYEQLYGKLWDNSTNSEVPVEGGRGASAAADWAANKYLRIPDLRGRVIIGTGTGGDDISGSAKLTARTNLAFSGEESHALTSAEGPSHVHNFRIPNAAYAAAVASSVNRAMGTNTTTSTQEVSGSNVMASSGSGTAHNNMQPWMAMYWQIKF